MSAVGLLALWLAAAPAEGGALGWDSTVRLPDLARGQLEVTQTFRGGTGPLKICSDLEDAAPFVQGLRQVLPSGERALPHAPGERACWLAAAPAEGPRVLRYRFDLAGLAAQGGDPDRALRAGEGFVLTEEAILLRPDPLPAAASLGVRFELPEGVQVVTPWEPVPGATATFRTDAAQFDGGSYLALGRLRSLPPLALHGGRVSITVLGGDRRASDGGLRSWVERAARTVVQFYGRVPGSALQVLLVPVPHTDRAGVFGSVLHRGRPSAVLFFGAEADDAAFFSDWVATHELFHAGIPYVEGRPSWFVEGVATYYQDVLRGRAGLQAPSAMWADLADGFRRFCDPVDGVSLEDESRRMRTDHSYRRVYWGGACVLFHLDVEIRRRSGGKRSLDDIVRALHAQGPLAEVSEADVRAALDAAAGPDATRKLLQRRSPLQTMELLRRLGVVPNSDETAELRSDSPEAGLRQGIF